MAKQQQYTNNKNRIEYFQLRQNTTTTAVAIRPHVSEAAYQKFHEKNPYLDDVVECLDNDVKVGASRGLVDYKNDTPKLHCIEDHAVDALERFPDLLLMIEEWVDSFIKLRRSGWRTESGLSKMLLKELNLRLRRGRM